MPVKDKKCDLCGTNMTAMTLHLESADVFTCPNCSLRWALDLLTEDEKVLMGVLGKVTPDKEHECCLCSNPASAVIHDFKFDEARTDVTWPACVRHARSFLRLSLKPSEVADLKCAVECVTYMTHEDFYDEDGTAVQPR